MAHLVSITMFFCIVVVGGMFVIYILLYCYIRGLHHVISVQCRIESQRNVRVMNKILILEEKAINKVIPYNTN